MGERIDKGTLCMLYYMCRIIARLGIHHNRYKLERREIPLPLC